MEENFLPSDLGHTTNRIHSDRIHNNEEKKIIYPQLINSPSINSSSINSPSINSFSKPTQEFNNEKTETKKKVN